LLDEGVPRKESVTGEEEKLESYGTSHAFCSTAAGALCQVSFAKTGKQPGIRRPANEPAAPAATPVGRAELRVGLEDRCLRRHGLKSALRQGAIRWIDMTVNRRWPTCCQIP
jgi:hypothetical protein